MDKVLGLVRTAVAFVSGLIPTVTGDITSVKTWAISVFGVVATAVWSWVSKLKA